MLEHPNIVFNREQLVRKTLALKAQGKRLVFTNGCYDILHPGHVDLLARARALGEVLLVALNTDASVQRLEKGSGRPFNTLAARAFVMAHLSSVDLVTCFDETTPYELIRLIEPDILVKGGDWTVENIVGAKETIERGGEVYSIPFLYDTSTTKTLQAIRLSNS